MGMPLATGSMTMKNPQSGKIQRDFAMKCNWPLSALLLLALLSVGTACPANAQDGSSEAQQKQWAEQIQETTRLLTQVKLDGAEQIALLSKRGDAHFFTGQFAKAVADYDRMLVADPTLKTSHWRRGIALYFTGQFQDAADQFEAYHSFDNVDRENGIWRYLCLYRAQGKAAAQATLLKYEKDDRAPFPLVYQLFEGKLTVEQLQAEFAKQTLSPQQRVSQEFYLFLYLGFFEQAEGHPKTALEALEKSVKNPWPQKAGYGPHYMWQVGRLERDRLLAPHKK